MPGSSPGMTSHFLFKYFAKKSMLRGQAIRPLTPVEVSDLRARYNLR